MAAGRRTLVRAAVLLALVAVAAAAAAANVAAPATSKSSSKHGCSSIAGCKSCSKSGCTSCKTGANLSGGKCYCPAGTGAYGSANTEPVVTGRRKLSQAAKPAAAASGTKPAHGSKGKGGKGGGGGGGGGGGASSFACAPCAADSYAATSKLVGQARCTQCPGGMQASEDRTTCIVPAGSYWNPSSGQVVVCPAGSWCPGGDFAKADEGRAKNLCPMGSTSAEGSDELGDCTVPPGSYYNADSGKVIKCPIGSYCAGGSIAGDGLSATLCPTGATTAAVGASTLGQCTVPPGSYYDEDDGTVKKCPVNTYCPGGSIEGGGASPVNCPAGTSFPAEGGDTLEECIVGPGFYWTGTAVAECPANNYCEGGPIGTAGAVVKKCPAGTTSAVKSDAIGDCIVPAGKYFDGTNVVTCPAGSYCEGGSITGDGAVKTACPANSNSVSGSDALADCLLDAGFYCVYTGTTCAVTQCAANQYCPGGVSVTNTNDDGSNPCPAGSISVAGSDAVGDCKIPAGSFCATYTGGVCSSIVQCPVNKYCPGGSSVTDTTNNGVKNCPPNTVSLAGSDAKADCELKPGYFCVYDAVDVCTVTRCPAGSYCPGGDSIEDPANPGDKDCPLGTTSPAGSNDVDDCVVAPGSYYDGTSVVTCPVNKYCTGGPISGAGSVANGCPTGSVSVAGSDGVSDCKIPAGSFCATYTGGVCSSIVQCPVNKYCPGGSSVTDTTNIGLKNCPPNTVSLAGSDAKADCELKPGYYCVYDSVDVCTVTLCPAGSYCPGGDSIEDSANPGNTGCPASTTSPVGSSSQTDCVIPAGSYWDGTAVVQCPAGSYCAGGPISGTGSVKTDCPNNSNSPAGSSARADCVLDPGYYCDYAVAGFVGTCVIKPCKTKSYCPGGASITNTNDNGAVACPANTYSSGGTTAQDASACILDPGYYCQYAAAGADCTVTLCDALYYCPGGNPITAAGTDGGRTSCPDTATLGCSAGCTVTSLPGSFKVEECTCSCAAPANICDGVGQVYDGTKCVCDYGFYASGATGPLYCLSCEGAYQPATTSVPYLSTSSIGATTKADCNTCTFGYTYTAGTPPTCNLYCDTVVQNSNSTSPGPSAPADCNKCAIGYYIVPGAGGNTDDTLEPSLGETCAPCPTPPGTGYGTGAIGTCTTTCKQDEWFDTTTGKCAACPTGRYTDPSLPLVTSSSTDGVSVCLCGPGFYALGDYSDPATQCKACNQPSDPNAIIRTVPKYGATSSAACVIGCSPGFYVKSTSTCFKCQNVNVWSPGSLADASGPTACYSCTGTGYVGARLMSDGTYKCNETGQFGNDACIPCKMCAAGTLPGGYSCPA